MSKLKIAKTWWSACSGQVLRATIILIYFVMVFVGLVVIALSLPLSPDQRSVLIFGGVMLAIFVMLLAILILAAYTSRGRTSNLDAAFSFVGLVGSAYFSNGRQYHGVIDGRQVDAYYYRGPTLDLYVTSSLHTRMRIVQKDQVQNSPSLGSSLPALTSPDPFLAHLEISSLDGRWARELLVSPQASESILRLTSKQPGFEYHIIVIQPEAVELQSHRMNPGSLTPDQLHDFLDDLFTLVRIAESLPPPDVPIDATPVEHRARADRDEFVKPVWVNFIIVLIFLAVAIILVVLAFIRLTNGG